MSVSTCRKQIRTLAEEAYPKVVSTSRKDFVAVADKVRDEARTKVTGQVDGITSLPTEASANAKDEEEEPQGEHAHVRAIEVVRIGEAKNDELENAACDKLGEEHAGSGHEGSGICAEQASGGVFATNGANVDTALKGVNGRTVVGVDDSSSRHGSKQLCQSIDRELAPGVATVEAVGKGNGGVEMAARLAGDEEAEEHTNAKKRKQG